MIPINRTNFSTYCPPPSVPSCSQRIEQLQSQLQEQQPYNIFNYKIKPSSRPITRNYTNYTNDNDNGTNLYGFHPTTRQPQQSSSSQAPKMCQQTSDYEKFLLTLNPKNETGILSFLKQNPTADGRGVIIAILDTGVDPGAPGLMQTTDGKVKILERYDCTGAGDVDTSTIVKSNIEITVLSGKTFKIPSTWDNPSGEFHIGLKPIYHLYPEELINRIAGERSDKLWKPAHRIAIAKAEKELEDYYKQFNKLSRQSREANNPNSTQHPSSTDLTINLHMTMQEKFLKAEIVAKVEVLFQLAKSQFADDAGPYLDCILFQNSSELWQICLVPNDITNLEQAIFLHEYNVYHEYSPLSPNDRFNVSVNVWNDGNVLEIVGMSDTHGTHVASIAAACFPDSPELNGVAPGAQIISCTIGDARLGAQETGTAYVRALARICEGTPQVHIINTSYGEPVAWPPEGNLAKLMSDAIDKKGITWVSASGNEGPALSTVDSPAAFFEDNIIGVAAYVSPEMMVAHANIREAGLAKGLTYTWCSRGPALNGAMAVNVCAPGGAITSVPNYTLMNSHFMHGSSMATPHATGCVALILSLALQRCIDWTPYSVKKSIEVSSINPDIPEPFSQGFGLIQVPNAYSYLEYLSSTIDKYIRYKIFCTGPGEIPGFDMQGIYIRNLKLETSEEYLVEVTPIFYQSETIDPSIKIMFKKYLTLVTEADWLEIPSNLEMHNESKTFKIRINPISVPGVYYTRVNALDTNLPRKGPVFSIDVTYIVPIPISYNPTDLKPRVNLGNTLYSQGQIKRYFIEAPAGATWAVLRLKTTNITPEESIKSKTSSFVVQTVTILPGQTFKHQEEWTKVKLQLNEEVKLTFGVTEGKVTEICIARWWPEGGSEIDEFINLVSSVKFRGIKILQSPDIITSIHDVYSKVDVANLISSEEIKPSAKLNYQVQLLKPNEMTLTTLLGPREQIPSLEKVIFELQIMYSFHIEKCTEIQVDCPLLSSVLYDSDYISQLWMLFNCHKEYIAAGDAFPERWRYKIPPGHYQLRLQVRHQNVNALYRFMVPYEIGKKSRSISKCKLNTTRSYDCGGQNLPLLSVLLKMELDSPINLFCSTNLYETIEYNECTDGDGGDNDDDDEEHTNCPFSSDFPTVLRKNDAMCVYIKTLINESLLEDFPSTGTTYLQGHFTITDHHAGKHFCRSNLKLYFPQNLSTINKPLTFGESEDEDDAETKRMPLHINPVDLLSDITKLENNLKNLNKIDLSIDYMILNKYYALAIKILLHRKKTHLDSWNKTCDTKLRECFDKLGWTHCIYFLDSNSVVQNPLQFRPF